MRRLLLFGLLLAVPISAFAAEHREPLGWEAMEPPVPSDAPCLTDAQRARIWSEIEINRDRLRSRGLLPEPKPGLIVLFDWPLRASSDVADFGYHGISNFVDQDLNFPDELLDYNCGDRTYDLETGYNHRGIDYFNWPFSWFKMDNDHVEIVSAAPGTIIGKDDGNFDRNCGFDGGDWNAVYVEHGDGSVSWYGHMKQGSLTTKEVGDAVAAGEFLGVVGSSGNSTGPHLHFETYDGLGNLIEPYAGPCNMFNDESWWISQRPYYDSAINALMTHDDVPEFPDCPQQEIPHDRDAFTPGSLVYFAAYYRDQLEDQTTEYSVLRPDLSEQWSWSHSSPDPFRAVVFWYWSNTLPGDAPEGIWTFRAVYEGQTYDHKES